MFYILLILVIIIGFTYLKARNRNVIALKKMTSLSEAPYPSWASNSKQLKNFLEVLVSSAESINIPEKFVVGLFDNNYSRDKLFFLAGMLEIHGSSFEEQTSAVFDRVTHYWSNMTDLEKAAFL